MAGHVTTASRCGIAGSNCGTATSNRRRRSSTPSSRSAGFLPLESPVTLAGGRVCLRGSGRRRSLFDDLRFTVEVGPFVDGEIVAGRWIAQGAYQGGIPGSTAPAGTRVRFHGNDIWRADGEAIREYWLSDDLLDLMQQLGVIPEGWRGRAPLSNVR